MCQAYYNEKEARDLCRILLDAVKYIHELGIVHRDLKPENLLLTSPHDDAHIKLADFGFARSVLNGYVSTQCGTPGYVAPEILRAESYGTVRLCPCGLKVPVDNHQPVDSFNGGVRKRFHPAACLGTASHAL